MAFGESFLLLQNEAYLIESCLMHGLQSLRNADLSQKGNFYTAFFQLSIGLERLMKIALIIDHMAKNKHAAPDPSAIRSYGHDLKKLFNQVHSIKSSSSPHPLDAIAPGSLEHDILIFLGEFAHSSGRYFNLNRLATKTPTHDPLAKWNEILFRILKDDVPKRTTKRIMRESQSLASSMPTNAMVVIVHDLRGQMLDFEGMVAVGRFHSAAAPYAVLRVFGLLRPLREMLVDVGDMALYGTKGVSKATMPVPAMSEFLIFLLHERRDILRKRRWP
jgi:hypothetical protein